MGDEAACLPPPVASLMSKCCAILGKIAMSFSSHPGQGRIPLRDDHSADIIVCRVAESRTVGRAAITRMIPTIMLPRCLSCTTGEGDIPLAGRWRGTVTDDPHDPEPHVKDNRGAGTNLPKPDYLPLGVREWALEHSELLELIVSEFVATGTWPSLSDLSRRLAREGQPVALRPLFWEMPKPLGLLASNPERVVFSIFGVRMTRTGESLLMGFMEILALAAERYAGDDPEPVITRSDVQRAVSGSDEGHVTAVSELLFGAPFLGNGTGAASEEWRFTISDDVVRYIGARAPDDYLRIRGGELAGAPQLGWPVSTLERADPDGYKTPAQDHVRPERRSIPAWIARIAAALAWLYAAIPKVALQITAIGVIVGAIAACAAFVKNEHPFGLWSGSTLAAGSAHTRSTSHAGTNTVKDTPAKTAPSHLTHHPRRVHQTRRNTHDGGSGHTTPPITMPTVTSPPPPLEEHRTTPRITTGPVQSMSAYER
jgi:hypothetical protein